MRRKRIIQIIISTILATIFILQTTAIFAVDNKANWFEYSIPNRGVMKGTALDMSWLLDAPAGKHGAISAVGENMFFADGTPVKFWGTNIAAESNFLGKNDADELVRTVVTSGYNMVRLHHFDSYFSDPNIFGSGEARNTTTGLNAASLDKFEYLWSQLKANGVYLYVDLLGMRRIGAGEVSNEVRGCSSGLKGMKYFEPELVRIQKLFMEQLLTHVNPYTKTTLATDPACAVVSITNEDSALIEEWDFNFNNNAYYTNLVGTQFAQWLKTKYSTDAALTTAWTQSGKIGVIAGESVNGKVTVPDDYYKINNSDQKLRDIRDFYYSKQADYYTELKAYLVTDLKVKSLICGSNAPDRNNALELHSYAKTDMDINDQHEYYNHPTSKSWLSTGDKVNSNTFLPLLKNFNSVDQPVTYFGERKAYNKPNFQSEWNVCFPNEYIADANYMMSAYSAMQGWNPIMYNLIQEKYIPSGNLMSNYYSTINNPYYIVTSPTSALMMLGNHVTQATDSYNVEVTKELALDRTYEPTIPSGLPFVSKTGLVFSDVENPQTVAEATKDNARLALLADPSKPLVSTTNELSMDATNGVMTVNTKGTKLVAGFAGGQNTILGNTQISFDNEYATVALSSITKADIETTDRLLITAFSHAQNTNMVLDSVTKTVVEQGGSPIVVEPVTGTVAMDLNGEYTAYALTSSGARKEIVPTYVDAQGKLVLKMKAEYKTSNYELVKTGEAAQRINVVVDYANQKVTTSGAVGLSGENVAITVKDSKGNIVYLNQMKSGASGVFEFAYPFDVLGNENFTANIRSANLSGKLNKTFTITPKSKDLNIKRASYTIVNNVLQVSFDAQKTVADSKKMYIILTGNKNNVIQNTVTKNVNILDNNVANITMEIPYNNASDYKLFVWNGEDTMTPLMQVQDFNK